MDIKETNASVVSIYQNGKSKRSECETASCIIESFKSDISAYKAMIPAFFSTHGEAAGIREIYKEIPKEPTTEWRMIDVIDLSVAGNLYKEYLEGMEVFVGEIVKTHTDVDSFGYSEKLGKAIENNDRFIDSLFGGTNNPSAKESIRDAMANIEYLIDLKGYMERYESFITGAITSSSEDSPQNTSELVKGALRLYCNSVSLYCEKVITTVFSTYVDIQDAIDYSHNRIVAKEPVSVPTYQLF